MHAKHAAQTNYFQQTWPHLDVERWPGRECYWCWRHPVLTLVLFPVVILGDISAIAHLIDKLS